VNGITLLALIAIAIGVVVAYRAGMLRARRALRDDAPLRPLAAAPLPQAADAVAQRSTDTLAAPPAASAPNALDDPLAAERFRILLALEAQAATLRRTIAARDAELARLRELAEDRSALYRGFAAAREESARLRQVLVDLENDAPPPLLDGPGAPDDLRLIVGVGPVLERMLQQLGITTYRQIARWSERDIDEFDARLPEFHGRIRRDGWVTQARALHHSKYGEPPSGPRG